MPAAISGPSQAPSPGPVFIPPPRLLTRVADTRPRLASAPGAERAAGRWQSARGKPRSQPAGRAGEGARRRAGPAEAPVSGHSCVRPLLGTPGPLCFLGRGVPGRATV